MKLAVIGATGKAGSRILAEALARGHKVTAIVRHPEQVPQRAGLTAAQGDVTDPAGLARLLAGHDAVISAFRFTSSGAPPLIDALKRAGVKRLLVVGGAGSLELSPDLLLVDTPFVPPASQEESRAGLVFLDTLRREAELEWTFLSPSGMFAPGERTGTFRLGGDHLLRDTNGKAWISMEDYAIAMLDEVEHPRHIRRRFTVGY